MLTLLLTSWHVNVIVNVWLKYVNVIVNVISLTESTICHHHETQPAGDHAAALRPMPPGSAARPTAAPAATGSGRAAGHGRSPALHTVVKAPGRSTPSSSTGPDHGAGGSGYCISAAPRSLVGPLPLLARPTFEFPVQQISSPRPAVNPAERSTGGPCE